MAIVGQAQTLIGLRAAGGRDAPPGAADGFGRTQRHHAVGDDDLTSIEQSGGCSGNADCTPFQTFDWLSAWQATSARRAA